MSFLTLQHNALAQRAAFEAEAGARTGIDEEMIRRLVHILYDRVRADAVLGPIFDARISDWKPHLAPMWAFWSSVMLMTGRYHGRPMQAHAALPIDAGRIDCWLALFLASVRQGCSASAAEHFIEKTWIITASLRLGIATHRGLMLANGEPLSAQKPRAA
jgi:hemoglobin